MRLAAVHEPRIRPVCHGRACNAVHPFHLPPPGLVHKALRIGAGGHRRGRGLGSGGPGDLVRGGSRGGTLRRPAAAVCCHRCIHRGPGRRAHTGPSRIPAAKPSVPTPWEMQVARCNLAASVCHPRCSCACRPCTPGLMTAHRWTSHRCACAANNRRCNWMASNYHLHPVRRRKHLNE